MIIFTNLQISMNISANLWISMKHFTTLHSLSKYGEFSTMWRYSPRAETLAQKAQKYGHLTLYHANDNRHTQHRDIPGEPELVSSSRVNIALLLCWPVLFCNRTLKYSALQQRWAQCITVVQLGSLPPGAGFLSGGALFTVSCHRPLLQSFQIPITFFARFSVSQMRYLFMTPAMGEN